MLPFTQVKEALDAVFPEDHVPFSVGNQCLKDGVFALNLRMRKGVLPEFVTRLLPIAHRALFALELRPGRREALVQKVQDKSMPYDQFLSNNTGGGDGDDNGSSSSAKAPSAGRGTSRRADRTSTTAKAPEPDDSGVARGADIFDGTVSGSELVTDVDLAIDCITDSFYEQLDADVVSAVGSQYRADGCGLHLLM